MTMQWQPNMPVLLAGWSNNNHKVSFEVMLEDTSVVHLYAGYDDETEYATVKAAINDGECFIGQPLDIARKAVDKIVSATWFPGCKS
jgi:hypothetical protein